MRAFTTRRLCGAAVAVAILAAIAAVLHTRDGDGTSREAVDRPAAADVGRVATRSRHAAAAHPLGAGAIGTLTSRRPTGEPVDVVVATGAAGPTVPSDFLGLSFEERSLPLIASYARPPAAGSESLVALLRSLGPGVLRFGGVSADEQVTWAGAGAGSHAASGDAALPRWADTAITTADLRGLAALARASGWRVLLTVNLGHYDPTAAAQEAAAARAALGSRLVAIAIGNEPDRYVGRHLRARGWSFAAYGAQIAAYRAAIARAAPGVPLAGPDPASGDMTWLRAAARRLRPELLTAHYYPLSSCGYRPTIGELLSANVRRKASAALAATSALAHVAATRLRLDEVNSVSCEGFPGTSDTFAAALWALDYSARAMAAGAAGVNFHDLLAKRDAYSALVAASPAALAAGRLRAAPEWYALLAARELPGSRPLHTSVVGAAGRAATGGGLDASAFRAPDGRLRLVLVDYDPPGSRPLAVRLRVPRAAVGASEDPAVRAHAHAYARGGVASTYTGGSVLRLTGPSPAARTDIRLAGRAVARNGSWSPPAALPGVYADRGALSVELAPSSAAVVTLYPG